MGYSNHVDFHGNDIWLADKVIVIPLNVAGFVDSLHTQQAKDPNSSAEHGVIVTYPLRGPTSHILVRCDEVIVTEDTANRGMLTSFD